MCVKYLITFQNHLIFFIKKVFTSFETLNIYFNSIEKITMLYIKTLMNIPLQSDVINSPLFS